MLDADAVALVCALVLVRVLCSGWVRTGGPDWPTSVLTGILGISLVPMLVGSLPIIGPLAFTTAAGSMMLKSSDPEFSSIGGFTLTLAGLSQMCCLVAAAMIIERTSTLRADEIAAMPNDEEVLRHEQAAEENRRRKERATQWSEVPTFMRLVLLLAAFCATVATIIFAGKGSSCFESVEVITDLSLPPINNNALNVIKAPYGYVALGSEAAALVLVRAPQQLYRYLFLPARLPTSTTRLGSYDADTGGVCCCGALADPVRQVARRRHAQAGREREGEPSHCRPRRGAG